MKKQKHSSGHPRYVPLLKPSVICTDLSLSRFPKGCSFGALEEPLQAEQHKQEEAQHGLSPGSLLIVHIHLTSNSALVPTGTQSARPIPACA